MYAGALPGVGLHGTTSIRYFMVLGYYHGTYHTWYAQFMGSQMPLQRNARAHLPAFVPCASVDAACRAAQLRGLLFHTANASELAESRWLRSSSCTRKGVHDRCSAANATEIQAWQRAVEVPSHVQNLRMPVSL